MDSNEEGTKFRVLALYKFVTPKLETGSLKPLQKELQDTCLNYRARGTLLLAEEGINGTICYPFPIPSNDDPLLNFIQSKFEGLRIRISEADYYVFSRLKIKVKKEIVTIHQDGISPMESVGEYVKPEHWNELINDPDTLVIDTRNQYEVDLGTFRNAVNPETQHFTEFPEWLQQQLGKKDTPPKKIAMFCTGGIRCEKSTGVCKRLVPENVPVYHLEGGILAYLNDVPQEKSMFDGECYVFDKRIAVGHKLKPSEKFSRSCYACRHPLSTEDVERDDFMEGLHCRWCVGSLSEKQKIRFEARQNQIKLAKERGEVHIRDPKEQMWAEEG
jgi:UPF0176 protein